MSTRFKLILLVVFTSLAGASSILINEFMMRPVSKIGEEASILDDLHSRLIGYNAQANRLESASFNDQMGRIETQKELLDESFRRVGEMELLPSINDSIKTSIETIYEFNTSIESIHTSILKRAESVVDSAEKIVGTDRPFTILQLVWSEEIPDKAIKAEVKQNILLLDSSTHVLNTTIASTITNLETQARMIKGEIDHYEKKAEKIILILILIVIIIPLGVAILIANMLADRIKKIDVGISRMKAGDLADRIEMKSNDEMGRLSNNVNDFTDALGESILKIKESSRNNMEIKTDLLSSVERVSQATNTAGESAQAITSNMDRLEETVQTTSNAFQIVEERLDRLGGLIEQEVTMIEETSASVTQMINSITAVTDITFEKTKAMTELVSLASEGGNKLDQTNKIITKIHDSIEEIRATAGLIAQIASRTNLLAMNAAIEAAHAGDSGKGFAVVADEIRKLAEATSQNSKRIDGVMGEIVGNIEEAAESGKTTGSVFLKVDSEVVEAKASFSDIANNMEELKTGGGQILDAMTRLNEFSNQVKEDGETMSEASAANRKAMENVNRISREAASRVEHISEVLETMQNEMKTVSLVTKKAEDISISLENEVKVYQTGKHVEA
ncbi:MAG: HAMP domain-containing protein [Spirochaetales bacterium]|nr:HAMP domain-containing protein [Spirochaetales bacterium]